MCRKRRAFSAMNVVFLRCGDHLLVNHQRHCNFWQEAIVDLSFSIAPPGDSLLLTFFVAQTETTSHKKKPLEQHSVAVLFLVLACSHVFVSKWFIFTIRHTSVKYKCLRVRFHMPVSNESDYEFPFSHKSKNCSTFHKKS